MPLPESATLGTEGEPAAGVKVRVALSAVAVLGVKVMVKVAVLLAPAAMVTGLVVLGVGETVKSVGFWPVKATPVTLIALLPLLVMVTVCGAEVLPLRTPPPLELTKVRLVGAIEAVACAPEPARASVGLPPLEVSASVAVSGRAGLARGVKVSVTLLWAPLAIESGLPALGTLEG